MLPLILKIKYNVILRQVLHNILNILILKYLKYFKHLNMNNILLFQNN